MPRVDIESKRPYPSIPTIPVGGFVTIKPALSTQEMALSFWQHLMDYLMGRRVQVLGIRRGYLYEVEAKSKTINGNGRWLIHPICTIEAQIQGRTRW